MAPDSTDVPESCVGSVCDPHVPVPYKHIPIPCLCWTIVPVSTRQPKLRRKERGLRNFLFRANPARVNPFSALETRIGLRSVRRVSSQYLRRLRPLKTSSTIGGSDPPPSQHQESKNRVDPGSRTEFWSFLIHTPVVSNSPHLK